MNQPFFSIVIPTLNEEKFLPHLLDSLTRQTYKQFEVLVVDGKSKDATVRLAEEFKKKLPSLRVVVAQKASLPLQRNVGAKEAKGEWFLFFDADDILLPYALERCADFIHQQKDVSFFTSWFTPDTTTSGDAALILVSNLFVEGSRMVKRQIAPGAFAAVRRDIFEASGGYDETRGYGEDQEFSMRLFERGIHLAMLRETIYIYSLRRFRKQGTLKLIQMYIQKSVIGLIMRRVPAYDPNYVMGGHIYTSQKQKKKSILRQYEKRLLAFLQEMFGTNTKH